jgi:predicted Zn-dependent protease
MGGLLFSRADVSCDALVASLRALPREQSDPVGFTPSMRRMWELRASARLGAGRYADSLADFRMLEKNASNDDTLAISRNNVAYTALMTGDPALRQEALGKARTAVEFKPDQRSFQGTYAFALLETGSPAEAAEILDKVAVDHPRPRDRALDLCLLAICRARLGDTEAARRHVVAAEAADSRCTLLARARAEIAAGETATTVG